MWNVIVVLAVLVAVVLGAKGTARGGGAPGASRGSEPTRIDGARGSSAGARMKRQSVVMVALLCAVVTLPQTTSAAGSYGAIVEKGFRGCLTDSRSGVVICFQSPTVNSQARGVFLQAWRSAPVHLAGSGSGPTTLFVRAVSARASSPQDGPPVVTYLASADLVGPDLACTADFRISGVDGVERLEGLVIACSP